MFLKYKICNFSWKNKRKNKRFLEKFSTSYRKSLYLTPFFLWLFDPYRGHSIESCGGIIIWNNSQCVYLGSKILIHGIEKNYTFLMQFASYYIKNIYNFYTLRYLNSVRRKNMKCISQIFFSLKRYKEVYNVSI